MLHKNRDFVDKILQFNFNNYMNTVKPIRFISFKGYNKTFKDGANCVIERYDDMNTLRSRDRYDESDRLICTNWYDQSGQDAGYMHKKYTLNGYIETCKTPTQEYTRTVNFIIKDGLKHHTEEYISVTNPKANYYNETIRELFGKVIKIISNGKVIFELKR